VSVFIVAIILYLAGLLFRDGYEYLKKNRRLDPTNPRIFAATFTAMIVMWFSWFAMVWLDPARLALPAPVPWIGLAAFLLGLGLAVGGMWQLKGVENIDHLVTDGLFSRVSHPMYAGFVFWILGLSVFRGAAISFAIGCLGLVSILWWRRLEERELLASYGTEYAEYRDTTWF
jgi:protein-S-isoprenylcysteine O-methyltransferase Ste14